MKHQLAIGEKRGKSDVNQVTTDFWLVKQKSRDTISSN